MGPTFPRSRSFAQQSLGESVLGAFEAGRAAFPFVGFVEDRFVPFAPLLPFAPFAGFVAVASSASSSVASESREAVALVAVAASRPK